MDFFLEIPTGIQIVVGVFIVIKIIFKYLSWLYYDRDKSLRENVNRAEEYVSQHSYFEIIKASLARLYNHLNTIFQKKIRFLYLFLLFFFLNLVSILAGNLLVGFSVDELTNILLNTYMCYDLPLNQLSLAEQVDIFSPLRYLTFLIIFTSQLSLLDICSFLFTVGIIYMASKSKRFIFLIIGVITDISILALFSLIVIFCLAYWWLIQDVSISIFGSFFVILFITVFISMVYGSFRYSVSSYWDDMSSDSFTPLFDFLSILTIPWIIMLYFSIQLGIEIGIILLIPIFPLILFWGFRSLKELFKLKKQNILKELFKLKKQNILDFIFLKIILILSFIFLLYGGTYLSPIYLEDILFGKLPYLLSACNSIFKFLLILLFSSAIPTLLHLIAISVAIIAKSTPKCIQAFINRHLDALSGNEEKVLSQLGNLFGGVGALITAVIMILT